MSIVVPSRHGHQVKESNKRPHWWTMSASWHAWAGAGLAIVFVLASVGAAAKMPIGCDGARIYENGANHKAKEKKKMKRRKKEERKLMKGDGGKGNSFEEEQNRVPAAFFLKKIIISSFFSFKKKAWGRIVMVALCATVVSGWYKLHGDNPVNLYGMAAALLAFLALGGMLNPPALANLAGPRKAKSKQ